MRLVSICRGITHYKSLGIFLPYPRRSITKNGERLPRIRSVLRFLLFPLDIHDGVRENATWWTRGDLLLHFARSSIFLMSRLPRKMLRSPLKHPTGVFLNAAFNSPPSQIVKKTEKPPQGWLFHFLVDPRGVEPLSENPLGRLSSWAVCYEVLPGGAQTDTRHRDGSPFLDDRLKDETPMHLPC